MAQTFFDFSVYFEFSIGLFTLVNPIGITLVFISMISYQAAIARNKADLAANLSVVVISWISLPLGDTILQLFGISIDSFCIARGILVVTIAMSMVDGELGEDKQNKQEKSETTIRRSIGVVSLALPLMTGPGMVDSTIVWGTRYHSISYLFDFFVAIALFVLCCWGLFRAVPRLTRVLRRIGINVIARIMGLLLVALGIKFIVTGIKGTFLGLFNQFLSNETELPYSAYFATIFTLLLRSYQK